MKIKNLLFAACFVYTPILQSAEIYGLREAEHTIVPHGAVSANVSASEIKRIVEFFDSIATLDSQTIMKYCTPLKSDTKGDSPEKATGSGFAVEGLIKEYAAIGKKVSYRLSFIREPKQREDTILVIAHYIVHQEEGDGVAMSKRHLFKYSNTGMLYWYGN